MSTSRAQRRLAAILAADVVGYSRLMGQDEAGTLAALKALRSELVDPKGAEHAGRVFKSTGDGLLAEFPSVVNAVGCAIDIQQKINERSLNTPHEKTFRLRIGINLGDIIVEDGDVFGDGVNVAARVESIAPPGGIAVTETVRQHLGTRLNLDFKDLGEQSLKNIEPLVRVFVLDDAGQSIHRPKARISDKPSIAVLPFQNMSGDPEQEYFADGLTEDLITELSRFRDLSVIARNSSFHYKGRSPKIQDVGRELGIQWVIEGSVRKSGTRVRVTAQLIDALTGSHVWAEKYDRVLEDIFQVQDEVVRAVAATVGGRVDAAGREKSWRLSASELSAYDLYLQAKAHFLKFTKEAMEKAIACSEKAVELDPSNVMALAYLALQRCIYGTMWCADEPQSELEKSLVLAKRAVEMDDANASAHFILGMTRLYKHNFEEARIHFERAVAFNPNDSNVRGHYAIYLMCAGKPEKAIEQLKISSRSNPFDASWFPWIEGIAYFTARKYQAAIDAFKRLDDPNHEVLLFLSASYAQAGQKELATSTMNRFLLEARSQMPSFPGKIRQGG